MFSATTKVIWISDVQYLAYAVLHRGNCSRDSRIYSSTAAGSHHTRAIHGVCSYQMYGHQPGNPLYATAIYTFDGS